MAFCSVQGHLVHLQFSRNTIFKTPLLLHLLLFFNQTFYRCSLRQSEVLFDDSLWFVAFLVFFILFIFCFRWLWEWTFQKRHLPSARAIKFQPLRFPMMVQNEITVTHFLNFHFLGFSGISSYHWSNLGNKTFNYLENERPSRETDEILSCCMSYAKENKPSIKL